MRPEAKAALLRKLEGFAEQLVNRPLTPLERGTSWSAFQGQTGTVSLLEHSLITFLDYVNTFTAKPMWGGKFSTQFIYDQFVRIMFAIHAGDVERTNSLLDLAVLEIEGFDTEQTVYIPITGVQLTVPELRIGNVVLRDADQHVIQEISTQRLKLRQGANDDPVPEDEISENQEDTESFLAGKTVAIFKIVAEPTRAAEIAEKEIRRAIGVLTYCHSSVRFYHPMSDAVVGLDGEVPHVRAWVGILSPVGFSFVLGTNPNSWSIHVTDQLVRQMDYFGFSEFSRLLALSDAALNEIDRSLLRAVHWYAESQGQATMENRLLNLMTCLEALLGPKRDGGIPITTTIAERTALILTAGYDERRSLREFISKRYGQRSGLSHGGETDVSEIETKQLRSIVSSVIRKLMEHRHDLASSEDLERWFERSRLTGRLASPGAALSVRELRENRDWSQVELADRMGDDPRMIDHWERVGPDLHALRRLGVAYSIGMDAIGLPRHLQLMNVQNHRFMLPVRNIEHNVWESEMVGWDYGDAVDFPSRLLDPYDPDSTSPLITRQWRERATTQKEALDNLETRIRRAMERALIQHRLPEDSPDWQPAEPRNQTIRPANRTRSEQRKP